MTTKRYLGYSDRAKAYADLETRFSSYNTKAEGLVCDSVANDRAALDLLVNTKMQATGGQLDVVGVVRIGSNMTIPANVTLKFMGGGYLAPDVGVTITMDAKLKANRSKIFGGGGTISFVTSKTSKFFPEWWGAVADWNYAADAGTDSTAAMTAAVNAAYPVSGIISLTSQAYGIANLPLPLSDGLVDHEVNFTGTNGSKLVQTATNGTDFLPAPSIVYGGRPRYRFIHLAIWGPDGHAAPSTYSGDGFSLTGTSAPYVEFEDVDVFYFYGVGKYGVRLNNMEECLFRNLHIKYCDGGMLLYGQSNNNQFDLLTIEQCVQVALDMGAASGNTFNSLLLQSNRRHALRMQGASQNTFNSPWFEANNTDAGVYYSIYMVSAAAALTQNNTFVSGTWNENSTYHAGIYGIGAAAGRCSGNRFIGGKMSVPSFKLDVYCDAWEMENVIPRESITDLSGFKHRVVWDQIQQTPIRMAPPTDYTQGTEVLSVGRSVALVNATPVAGPVGKAFCVIVRDMTTGFIALILYDHTDLVAIGPQTSVVFVTGAPAANQIQVTTVGGAGGIQFTAGATRAGDILQWTVLGSQIDLAY